jgi:hypothetical protein
VPTLVGALKKGEIMRRTTNHITRYRCSDVGASFAKRRAALVESARIEGATVLADDGEFFHAERLDSSKSRVTYMACRQGAPFVNGPSIVKRFGAIEYADLLLPRSK